MPNFQNAVFYTNRQRTSHYLISMSFRLRIDDEAVQKQMELGNLTTKDLTRMTHMTIGPTWYPVRCFLISLLCLNLNTLHTQPITASRRSGASFNRF